MQQGREGGEPMRGERVKRRLTAILAADVAGYSRLVGADEVGTLARLRHLRRDIIEPRVRLHHGRVVKTMGDGLLIEFASAVAAVCCAFDIQAEVTRHESGIADDARLRFRVGINLGDVIHERGDVFGDGVNVAARLEQLAEPGGICVARNVFDQVRDRLPVEHDYLGDQIVKNIARPVKTYRIRPGAAYRVPPLSPSRRRWWLAAAAAAATAAVVAFVPRLAPDFVAEPPTTRAAGLPSEPQPRLSIAVLPFDNLSGDPTQSHVADGITEDLITDLSRIPGAFVIARNTSFTYKGKPADVRQVAQELGVRYVLEGSVRRDGGRLRINAQLIDAETGGHIWADRLDNDAHDLFAIQGEITGRIARTLNLELLDAETRRVRQGAAPNPDAHDLALQAWVILLSKPQTSETNAEAEPLIEEALALDPHSALAWTAATYLHTRAGNFGWSGSAEESLRRAVEAGERATELDPRSSDAAYMLGYALRSGGRLERAIAAMERAIALNPNNPLPYQGLAYCKILIGLAAEAKPLLDRAFSLSPREPLAAVWHWTAAYAQLLSGDDAGAVASARKAIAINPKFPRSYWTLAAAAAHLGQTAEARAAISDYLAIAGGADTIPKLRKVMSLSPDPTFQRQLDRVVDGLRKAGMPDS